MNVPVALATRPRRSAAPASGKYKLRVSDYMILDEAGTFAGSETELVDGDVIVMSPEWMPHMRIKDELAYQLRRAIENAGLDLIVGTGGSVALSDTDMPRPDVIVMRPVDGDGAVPREAVLLFVEVSSSTLRFDLEEKASTYARHGIEEYWVVDVNGRVIHQMWTPTGAIYAEHREVAFGEQVAVTTVERLTADTHGL